MNIERNAVISRTNISRRDVLRALSVGFCSWSTTHWMPALVSAASAAPAKPKSVILLWLNGGPATIDLWDLKPGHANGGPFQEISTSVAGMKISEHLPKLSQAASDFSIIRSMSTREGDHSRARFVSLTGYTPQGAIQFPAVGSLVAHEFEDASRDIPSYVHIGGRPRIVNGGFLGPKYAPFVVGGGGRRGAPGPAPASLKVADLAPSEDVSQSQQAMRLALAGELRGLSAVSGGSQVVDALDSANDRALRLMRPEAAAAFDLEQESKPLRETYGAGSFGQGCLMARRLVERGVSFVEVVLDGWDTHNNNFERVKELSQQLDSGFAALTGRSETARTARTNARGLPGRVRSHPQDQRTVGPRPLAFFLGRRDGGGGGARRPGRRQHQQRRNGRRIEADANLRSDGHRLQERGPRSHETEHVQREPPDSARRPGSEAD